MKNKMYRIKNSKGDTLGMIKLDFLNDTGVIYLLASYNGLESDFFLSYWRHEEGLTEVTGDRARYWVHRRVCPPGRHNIKEILKSNGLTEYNASVILANNGGRCDKDDFWFEEV